MEENMRALSTVLMMGLVLNLLSAGVAEAFCTVKNSSSKDIFIVPVSEPTALIKVVVGGVTEIPSRYSKVIFKNGKTGKSAALELVDGLVLICLDGITGNTISIFHGTLLNGVISLLTGSVPLLTI